MASESSTEYKVVADKIVSPDNNINIVVAGNVYVGATQASNRVATIADINNGGGGGGNADIADFVFNYDDENTESTMTIHNHDMIIRTTRDEAGIDSDIELNSADDIWITGNDDIEITSNVGEVSIFTNGLEGTQWRFRRDGYISLGNNDSGFEAISGDDVIGRLKFNTGNGQTVLQAYSGTNSSYFESASNAWATATWTSTGETSSELSLTVAPNIISFIEGEAGRADLLRISINESSYGTYDGASWGAENITFYINNLPHPGGEVTVTALAFQYRLTSKIDINFDEGDLTISTEDGMDIVMESSEDVRLKANDDVFVTSNWNSGGTQYEWRFNSNGELQLPGRGYINNPANSSGDDGTKDTLQLVPDSDLTTEDQYVVIDPTNPNHIHIRAGGTIDDSNAELYLGGELAHVRVEDSGHQVSIKTHNSGVVASQYWTFQNDGTLYGPTEGGSLAVTGIISGVGATTLPIYSNGAMTLTANGGDMNLYMDGGLYIGNSASENQILKRSDISNVSRVVSVPETASSTGTTGHIAADSNYLYVCVATNTWKRVALSTW